MSITIDSVAYSTPAGEGAANKVQDYAAIINAINAAFASWVPSWTNFTLGNGVVTAKYRQVGKLVMFHLTVVLGTTSSVTGDITFSVPVTRAAYGSNTVGFGLCRFFDTSAGAVREGRLVSAAVGTMIFRAENSSGTYSALDNTSSTVPFTWAVGDELGCQGWYEAA